MRLSSPYLGALPVLLMVLLVSAPSLSSQEHLVDARASLDWAGADVVRVSIRYRVQPVDGLSEVPLAGLLFGGSELSGVRVVVADLARTIELSRSPVGRVTGSIPLSRFPATDEPISLELLYDVIQAGSHADGVWRWRIPILAVMWPPLFARPTTFTLEALIPAEYSLLESFPTNLRDAGEDGARRRYVTEAPVVPALVSLRVAEGKGRMTAAGFLNVAVPILLFGSMSILGWRYLKEGE